MHYAAAIFIYAALRLPPCRCHAAPPIDTPCRGAAFAAAIYFLYFRCRRRLCALRHFIATLNIERRRFSACYAMLMPVTSH